MLVVGLVVTAGSTANVRREADAGCPMKNGVYSSSSQEVAEAPVIVFVMTCQHGLGTPNRDLVNEVGGAAACRAANPSSDVANWAPGGVDTRVRLPITGTHARFSPTIGSTPYHFSITFTPPRAAHATVTWRVGSLGCRVSLSTPWRHI